MMTTTETIHSTSGMPPSPPNRGAWALFAARFLSAVTGIIVHVGEFGGPMGWWDWS